MVSKSSGATLDGGTGVSPVIESGNTRRDAHSTGAQRHSERDFYWQPQEFESLLCMWFPATGAPSMVSVARVLVGLDRRFLSRPPMRRQAMNPTAASVMSVTTQNCQSFTGKAFSSWLDAGFMSIQKPRRGGGRRGRRCRRSPSSRQTAARPIWQSPFPVR